MPYWFSTCHAMCPPFGSRDLNKKVQARSLCYTAAGAAAPVGADMGARPGAEAGAAAFLSLSTK